MTQYIIFAISTAATVFLFWKNRKNLEDSIKHGESGFSARKLIAFQLMCAIFLADMVYIWLLYQGNLWAQKIFNEWQNTHLLYVMFVLGFLSVPEIIKLINTIRGKNTKDDTNETASR